MLQNLAIQNFAIIDDLTVEFSSGMTVLTGETGAGKSIIIDALGQLAGGRASVDYIRHGQDKAVLQALYTIDQDDSSVYSLLEENNIEISEGQLIIYREISNNGRSMAKINGVMVTVSLLKEITSSLIDIHGQHEHQELMNAGRHQHILDQFGKDDLGDILIDYQKAYGQLRETAKELKRVRESNQDTMQRIDYLRFQSQELFDAKLEPGELDRISEERNQLANFQKIAKSLQGTHQILQEAEVNALDLVSLASDELNSISKYSEHFKNLSEMLAGAYYSLEEVDRQVSDYLDQASYDENRLDILEERLDLINRLVRKYGKNPEELIVFQEELEVELNQLENRDDYIRELEEKYQIQKEIAVEKAVLLNEVRQEVAVELEESVEKELQDLYMTATTFEVRFTTLNKLSWTGNEAVEFYVATNVGEPLKPLVKTASGGELSRIMLALKTILTASLQVETVVFDEVDTGVGGRVAQAIGNKMFEISQTAQVLAISHHPQVAAIADYHAYIHKHSDDHSTRTGVKLLDSQGRQEELARMLAAGDDLSDLTRQHAQEYLDQANYIQEQIKMR